MDDRRAVALWAHVRWESKDGKVVTPWSDSFGFNMRWTDNDYPQQLTAPEGLIRWKPIEGATRYEVLYPDIAGTMSFQTTTNVADEREFFTFPATSFLLPLGQSDTGTWWYRVRGVNPALPNGAQAMSWSKAVRLRITGDRFVVVK